MQRAALSAGSDQAPALVDTVLGDGSTVLATASASRAAFVRQLASVVGARQKAAEVRRIVDAVSAARGAEASWWRAAALDGLAQARGRRSARGTLAGARAALLVLHEDPAAEVRAGALGLLQLVGSADDATWRAAVRRAVAAAEQETDAHRRAKRHRAGALDRPGARTGWRDSSRRTSRTSSRSPR